jgi:hypothetical protein
MALTRKQWRSSSFAFRFQDDTQAESCIGDPQSAIPVIKKIQPWNNQGWLECYCFIPLFRYRTPITTVAELLDGLESVPLKVALPVTAAEPETGVVTLMTTCMVWPTVRLLA